MPRDNICIYIAHVCFYVCCSGLWECCCVAAVVEDSDFSLGVLKYVCVRDVMAVVFSVCIVRRGDVGPRCCCLP